MVELLCLNQHNFLSDSQISMAIIPTVLLPLTFITVALSSTAAMIAGWFGVKLNTEGPKQLLEVLLKKRVLLSMLAVNLLGWGLYRSYVYLGNAPSFIFTIEHYSKINAVASSHTYTNARVRPYSFTGQLQKPGKFSIALEKEIKLPMGAFRSGLISGESIFFGSDDGNLYELDKNSLKIIRTFYIGKPVSTRPVIFNNVIYAGEGNHLTHHARIYAFDLRSGRYLNSFETSGHTEGQPVIGNSENQDLIFIPSGSDGLYAVTPELKLVWHNNDGHVDASVAIEEGVVYSGTGVEKGNSRDRSFAVAYDFKTGKSIWKKELPMSSWMHPIVSKRDVCYVLGEIYLPSTTGQFFCLDKKTGQPHFSLAYESPIASKPYYINTPAGELVFFSGISGEVCGINLTVQEKIWCKKTSLFKGEVFTSVDFDLLHQVLWFPSFDNGLFAFNPASGEIVLQWKPQHPETRWSNNYASVTADKNYLYQADIDGHVRKFIITLH